MGATQCPTRNRPIPTRPTPTPTRPTPAKQILTPIPTPAGADRWTATTLRHYGGPTASASTLPDGAAHLDALLTTWAHPQPRIFTTAEQRLFPDTEHTDRRRRIPVIAAVVGFDDDRRWHERGLPAATAFHMIHAARLDDVWCSITAFLRARDLLTLHWRADNNNQHLRQAGLHRDELRLHLRRAKRHWTFLIEAGAGPDTTTRMIRHGAPTEPRTSSTAD